jgi:hypothetical protein
LIYFSTKNERITNSTFSLVYGASSWTYAKLASYQEKDEEKKIEKGCSWLKMNTQSYLSKARRRPNRYE